MQMDNWYVLHVRTGRELSVAEAARELDGVNAVVPIYTIEERHDGVWSKAHKLLFPGYVFVQTERLHAKRYYEFKRLDGVIRLLGLSDGDIPRPVPAAEMDDLLSLMDTGYKIGISEGIRKENGKVEITAGPLAGLQGKISVVTLISAMARDLLLMARNWVFAKARRMQPRISRFLMASIFVTAVPPSYPLCGPVSCPAFDLFA